MSNNGFKLNGLATAIGAMPHSNPHEACSLLLTYLPEIPVWPQLPKRSFRENMYVQFSEGLPGVVVEEERIWIDRTQDLNKPLEQLYSAYLEGRTDHSAIGRDYAEGLYTFLEQQRGEHTTVKGHVTGPISFGLTVTDQNRRPLLYDDVLADALAKHLRLKAMWQENALRNVSPNTIMFIDEPYLSSLGSAFVSLPGEQVVTLLEEVLGGIRGLKAIHCCGNTDWSVLLKTSIDILSFDAYNYGEALGLYPAEVNSFIARGGIIAWGIVPNEEQALLNESESTLMERLEKTMGALGSKGIDQDRLQSQCLITPSCGLGTVTIETAEKALKMTRAVSRNYREMYHNNN